MIPHKNALFSNSADLGLLSFFTTVISPKVSNESVVGMFSLK